MAQQQDTSQEPVRIALIGEYSHRDATATKDLRFINVISEVIDNKITRERKIYLLKRPAFNQTTFVTTAGVGRGVYYWAAANKWYNVAGANVYENGIAIIALPSGEATVSFVETDGATKYLVIADGVNGYYITTGGAVTQIADADFPTPHVAQLEIVDGYIFAIKVSTGEIFNCDINNPASWNATNFFQATMYPDPPAGLSRYKNLLVVFGTYSSEFYFDAANATGSPMSRVEQMAQEIGISSYQTVARAQDQVVFVAQSKAGRFVAVIKDDKFVPVSNPTINRILNAESFDPSTAAGKATTAFITYSKGHPLYVLNLGTIDRTYVYDLINDHWFEWSSNISGVQHKFNFSHGAVGPMFGQIQAQAVQHATNGSIYQLLDSELQDPSATNVLISVTTNKFDADSIKRKFLRNFDIIGDSTTTTSNINVSWTDDDYQTYSTARQIGMSLMHKNLVNCGSFRRRAFKLTHEDNAPFRVEAIELDYELGSY